MGTKPESSDDPTMLASSRHYGRFAVGGRIQCEIQGPDIVVSLLNVGGRGFLVRSSLRTRVGDVQRYRFIIEKEHRYIFVLRAQVVHCAASTRDGITSYLTGLQFLDAGTPVCQRAVDHLIGIVG